MRSKTMDARELKTIFVIMPFAETPTRTSSDLTLFFDINLKARIEQEKGFKNHYQVRRSDNTFNITAQIIRDLYEADIVLCDLSGINANPNVMYELGMRLAFSNKPVILFREEHSKNKPIFDIHGFYTESYKVTQYPKLENYIIEKIKKFEAGDELYVSPVRQIIKDSPSV